MMVSAYRLLRAALLAGLALGIALPASAAPPIGDIIETAMAAGPALAAADDDHGDVCCRPGLDSHTQCHASAALIDDIHLALPVGASETALTATSPLRFLPLPPYLRPPILSS